jgi:hypothetical protein
MCVLLTRTLGGCVCGFGANNCGSNLYICIVLSFLPFKNGGRREVN